MMKPYTINDAKNEQVKKIFNYPIAKMTQIRSCKKKRSKLFWKCITYFSFWCKIKKIQNTELCFTVYRKVCIIAHSNSIIAFDYN